MSNPYGIGGLFGPYEPIKRKAFFSFHFDDVMRVNNVRMAFKFYNPGDLYPAFYDSSLWEDRQLENDETIKQLIRDGVGYTSVVCVLTGSLTYTRRWCRYEIARSVVDGKGLVSVHINSINHHQRRVPDPRGPNPAAYLGITKNNDGSYRLAEWSGFGWNLYRDYSLAVNLPRYMSQPTVGRVIPLNHVTREYDFAMQNGSKNIGGWLDMAANDAGR
jgi:hypothetical protein